MIIFYNKDTGKIVGTIDGRVHGKEHMNMWIGDKDKTDRIVVNWKESKGLMQPSVRTKSQREIYIKLDKKPDKVYDYVVNTKTKGLNKKQS